MPGPGNVTTNYPSQTRGRAHPPHGVSSVLHMEYLRMNFREFTFLECCEDDLQALTNSTCRAVPSVIRAWNLLNVDDRLRSRVRTARLCSSLASASPANRMQAMLSMKLDYLLNQRPVQLSRTVSSRWLPNSSALTSAVSLYLWMRSSHAVCMPKAVWAKLALLMASGSPRRPARTPEGGRPPRWCWGARRTRSA